MLYAWTNIVLATCKIRFSAQFCQFVCLSVTLASNAETVQDIDLSPYE